MRKGISPIFAVILLIALVIGTSTILFSLRLNYEDINTKNKYALIK